MPGRLVKHEKVRFHEQGRTQLHLHLPTAGVAGHNHACVGRTVAADTPRLVAEPDLLERFSAHLRCHRRLLAVDVVHRVLDPLDTGQVDVQDREAYADRCAKKLLSVRYSLYRAVAHSMMIDEPFESQSIEEKWCGIARIDEICSISYDFNL